MNSNKDYQKNKQMQEGKATPLLIISVDGIQEKWLMDWINEGYLPTLATFIQTGSHGKIKGKDQFTEHGAELSLFSGLPRAEHGYYHFRKLQKERYEIQPANPHLTNAKPFWADLPKSKKMAILDLTEVPLLKGANGIQLTNWLNHQSITPHLPPATIPTNLLDEVRNIYGERAKTSEYQKNTTKEKDRKDYHIFLRQIKRKGKLISTLLQKDKFDLVVTSFYELHQASHRLWDYNPDKYSGKDDMKDCIKNLYIAIDKEIKAILDVLPTSTNVFITSTISMKSQYPTGELVDEFCKKLGYQKEFSNHSIARFSSKKLNIIRKLIPEPIRFKLSQRLGSVTQERLLSDNLKNTTDWANTVAFSQPTLYTGMIRINLKGRNPQGTINQGKEYVTLINKIKADLEQLINPVTGQKAVESITIPYEIYNQTIPQELPDLLVEWKENDLFIEKVEHPKATINQRKPDYYRNSWHYFEGFWAARGPDIRKDQEPKVKGVLDFALWFKTLASK